MVEGAINNLKDVQLGLAEMSDLIGGKCLFAGRFLINGGCACDKKNFLPIGKVVEEQCFEAEVDEEMEP